MTTGMVERAVLNDAEADALRVLANIYIGTPDCHIRREDANALINYMSRLENERSELRSALTDAQEIARRGDDIILGLEKTLDAVRSSLTASGEALRTVRDGLICTRQAPHQYDANHYCANCGSDHARLKDVIDAAMEKANG